MLGVFAGLWLGVLFALGVVSLIVVRLGGIVDCFGGIYLILLDLGEGKRAEKKREWFQGKIPGDTGGEVEGEKNEISDGFCLGFF